MLLLPIQAGSGQFTIYQNGIKIGTEEFSISLRQGGYVAEGRTRLSVGNQNFDLRSRMELNNDLKPTFYEYQSRGNVIRLKIDHPVSELEFTVDGKTQPHDIRFPADGIILDDNFFHHYLILLYRPGIAGASVSAFVPQQMTLGPLMVRRTGEQTYELETSNVKAIATTDLNGRLVRLTVPEASVVVER
jgi:hypothetical protein